MQELIRVRGAAALVASAAVFAACSPKPASDMTVGDTGRVGTSTGMATAGAPAAPAAPTATKVATVANLKTPESVLYDDAADVYFVSNINGNPSEKDGNGFVAKLKPDSLGIAPTMLVEGGKNGATLNAPKGMALQGDTLWVADIDAVRAFDATSGKTIATVDLSKMGATFLNDVAVGTDGAIYVTDTGIRFDAKGGMTHPGKDRVFKISGRTASVVIESDSLKAPNGITWDKANNRWIVVQNGGTGVMALAAGATAPTLVGNAGGGNDGVEFMNGRLLVSSWGDSSVTIFPAGAGSPTTTGTKLITGVPSPADIGVDTKRNRVLVPIFTGNRVEVYEVK